MNAAFGRIMTVMCEKVGINFWINNQTLHVLKITDVLTLDPLLLKPDTGLLGSPTLTEDGGVRFRCLIVPGILIGREAFLSSRYAFGGWKIVSFQLQGDTDGPMWNADVEGATFGISGVAA